MEVEVVEVLASLLDAVLGGELGGDGGKVEKVSGGGRGTGPPSCNPSDP